MLHNKKSKMNKHAYIVSLLFFAVIILLLQGLRSCSSENKTTTINQIQVDSVVFATVETKPVHSVLGEDAADDPAIWYNKVDPGKSLIIGTNKKAGLHVYDLEGKELFFTPVGLVNNVDVRYNFPLPNGDKVDFLGATNRTDNSLTLMAINGATGELTDIAARKIISGVSEVYGFSLYHNKTSGKYYAFVGGKLGETEQYELIQTDDNKIDAKLLRTYKFATQTEGMVADDELGILYVGEENHCIWKVNAEPDTSFIPIKLAESDSTNPKFTYDIEGLSIYYAEGGKGYLIASVQGNYSYALFERNSNNKFLGTFTIKTKGIDGVEETDGLDVTNLALNNNFKQGVFVVQDGFNYDGDSLKTQNFKLVPWESVANLMEPALIVDNKYSVYMN